MPRFLLIGLGCLLLLLGPTARLRAQDYTPPVLWAGYAGQPATANLLFETSAGRVAAGAKGAAARPAHPAALPAVPVSLPFRRDPAIMRQVQEATVNKVKASNPAAAEQLAQVMAQHDLLAAWGEALQQFHLELNNVADAMTANWLVVYLAANQLPDQPSAAQVAGLRRQVGRLCATPGMQGLLATDAKRQELADYLHLQALLINEAQSTAEKNHDAASSVALAQQARATGQQNMGFDPTTVRLTTQGFVKK